MFRPWFVAGISLLIWIACTLLVPDEIQQVWVNIKHKRHLGFCLVFVVALLTPSIVVAQALGWLSIVQALLQSLADINQSLAGIAFAAVVIIFTVVYEWPHHETTVLRRIFHIVGSSVFIAIAVWGLIFMYEVILGTPQRVRYSANTIQPPPGIEILPKAPQLAPKNRKFGQHVEVLLVTGIENASMPMTCGKEGVRCYKQSELRGPIPLIMGEKGWARIVYRVHNMGTETIPPPNVQLLSRTPQVLLGKIPPDPASVSLAVLYSEHVTLSLEPARRTKNEYQYPFDVIESGNAPECELEFMISSRNLPTMDIKTLFTLIARENK